MVQILIEDKTYQFPTSWNEVTVDQFFRLRDWDQKDFIKMLSILSGASYETIFKCKDEDIDVKLLPLMDWLKKPLTEKDVERFKVMTFDGKQYKIPRDIGQGSFGQKLSLQNRLIEIMEKTGNTINCLPFAVAVYMQPIVTGKEFSTEAADAFVDEVMKTSISEAWSCGNFFLKKLNVLQNAKNNFFIHHRTRMNWRQRLTRWINSKNSKQSTSYRAATF